MTERMQKLLKAAEIILPQEDRQTELDKLVAASMPSLWDSHRV